MSSSLFSADRTFYYDVDGCISSERRIKRGLPQGSPLSVLLWLVFISDIPVEMKTSALFMDDTNIWSVEDSMSEVIHSLNDQVSKVVQWCSDNDVLINAKKSVVLFNSAEEDLTVKIGEAEVGPSQSGKYLGFQFK